jgi:hypothetical protein
MENILFHFFNESKIISLMEKVKKGLRIAGAGFEPTTSRL